MTIKEENNLNLKIKNKNILEETLNIFSIENNISNLKFEKSNIQEKI